MIARTFHIGDAAVEVIFEWDPGDPSTNIGAGWGENTGAAIKIGDTHLFISFEVTDGPVETWPIDDIQLIHDKGFVADLSQAAEAAALGSLPDVCDAVKDTWEQIQAQEAVERSKDSIWEIEGEISDLDNTIDGDRRVTELMAELTGARAEHERLRSEYDRKYAEQIMESDL